MESNKPEEKVLYYGDYLQLNNILNAQKPIVRPGATGPPEHEQMLFIIVHQTYELWFKQVLHELDSITDILSHPILDDNSPQMQTVVDRLKRINTILRVLVHQIDIVETLTPMQFLQFRNLLVPSSGFQSWQFKLIDARLGLVEEQRHGLNYYVSVLREEDIQKIREAEAKPTLLKLFGEWLERMPFFNAEFWGGQIGEEIPPEQHPFWTEWERNYDESLRENEKSNLERFRKVMFSEKRGEHCQLSAKACRSALFISAYQLYPILSQPFAFLQELLQIDNNMSAWRFRHLGMVKKVIGMRAGTGGSSGTGYLKGAMDKHFVFFEIAELNSYLMDPTRNPKLPEALTRKLCFHI